MSAESTAGLLVSMHGVWDGLARKTVKRTFSTDFGGTKSGSLSLVRDSSQDCSFGTSLTNVLRCIVHDLPPAAETTSFG